MKLLERVYWMGRCWYWRFKFVQGMEKSLERRVEVENYLLMAAVGKRPLPDAAKCRELAMKLGVR